MSPMPRFRAKTSLTRPVKPVLAVVAALAVVVAVSALLVRTNVFGRWAAARGTHRHRLDHGEQWTRANNLATALNVAGNAYARRGHYDSALSCYRDALRLAGKYDLKHRAAASYLDIGSVYTELHEPESARAYCWKSDSVQRAMGKRSLRAGDDLNEGVLQFAVHGDLNSAERRLKIGLLRSRSSGRLNDEEVAVYDLGSIHGAREQYDSARYYYRLALALARRLKDRGREAEALDQLGLAWETAGRPDSALPYLQEAVTAARDAGSAVAEARALSDLGFCRFRTLDFELAKVNLELALGIYESLGNHQGAVVCQNYIELIRDNLRWSGKHLVPHTP
jgi:tetratricopeptide (TPR) repeat protein